MNNSGFDASRLDHWLLIFSSVGTAGYGLWISWQWNREKKQRRSREQMAYRLTVEMRKDPGLQPSSRQLLTQHKSSTRSRITPKTDQQRTDQRLRHRSRI